MSNQQQQQPQEPATQRLELTLNPIDGSLSTESLLNTILASTNGLYSDFYNMAHGELEVTTTANEEEGEQKQQTKKDQMNNLSFAQRRHELSWRLAQHSKALQHVAALTATAASSDLARDVEISSKALQHARASWVQADEAQDSLYFFHAQLFPARAAPHDIYGALDIRLNGAWYDLPNDLRLIADRYEVSKESTLSKVETDERWQMAVREKLLKGEIGEMRKDGSLDTVKWKVSLRGGILKLTVGESRLLGREIKPVYPIEALLSVLSTSEDAEWTLLSIEVKVQAKAGEFNHQLETSKRQRFDLHRLSALAMAREEARARKEERIAKPLSALFEASHTFLLSWQLEMLSSQAQALRRGAWAAVTSDPIHVTPVSFYDNQESGLGVVYISFWKVNEDYGRQTLSDLSLDGETSSNSRENRAATNQLTLSIRAEATSGIKVSLSGAGAMMKNIDTKPHIKDAIAELIEAASSPFALSASDALLAATKLCSEQRCVAVCDALQSNKDHKLPEWIRLAADRDRIAVLVQTQYSGVEAITGHTALFHLSCDIRTGSFVCIFPRCSDKLRRLAGNDVTVSEALAMRVGTLRSDRQRSTMARSTGRYVKDRFDSLVRSMNALAQCVGLGPDWDNRDDQSSMLRERSVASACSDVRASLMSCCALSSLFTLFPLAVSTSTGMPVTLDRCGDPLEQESFEHPGLLPVPPAGVMLDQSFEESHTLNSDGTQKKERYLRQSFLACACTVTSDVLTLYPVEIIATAASPTALVERKSFRLLAFTAPEERNPPKKKQKRGGRGRRGDQESVSESLEGANELPLRIADFSKVLSATIDSMG